MLTLFLKACYLGFCGIAMPLPIFIYLVYMSVRAGAKSGRMLFLGHFTASAVIAGLLFAGAKEILVSPAAQIVLLALGCIMPVILGISMIKGAFREKPEAEIVSDSSYGTPQEPGTWLFLAGAVMSFTSVSWISWCAVSANGLLMGAKQSQGFFGALLMVVGFIIAVFLLYWLLSAVFSLVGRLMKSTIYRVAVGVLGGCMIACAVMNLVQIVGLFPYL